MPTTSKRGVLRFIGTRTEVKAFPMPCAMISAASVESGELLAHLSSTEGSASHACLHPGQ